MQRRRGSRVLGPYKEPRGGWRVVLVEADGKRTATTCESEADALRVKREAEDGLAQGDVDVPSTVEEAVTMYLGWATTAKKKPIRPSSAETRRGQILALLPGRLALATLTTRRCQALYDELRERPTRFKRPPSAAYHQQALQEARRLGADVPRLQEPGLPPPQAEVQEERHLQGGVVARAALLQAVGLCRSQPLLAHQASRRGSSRCPRSSAARRCWCWGCPTTPCCGQAPRGGGSGG